MNSNLIPVQRTNKLGVTSRRWVLPESSAAGSASIPAPEVASAPVPSRAADYAAIKAALLKEHVHFDSFRALLDRARSDELRLIASALEEHSEDDFFQSKMAVYCAVSSLENAIAMAVVYRPDLYSRLEPERLRQRSIMIQEAVQEAEEYYRSDDKDEEDNEQQGSWSTRWNLANEDDDTQRRVKLFVAAWCTVGAGTEFSHPEHEVMVRVMNAAEDEAEQIIRALRIKPDATVPQINFMIEGGMSVLADGAL